MKRTKLGGRFWAMAGMVGFIGQLAWAIENNYINLWVFSQTGSTEAITVMTIVSALVATLTTFFIGTLSDRVGKRKVFISWGYIIWGITVFLFGLISRDNMASAFGLDKAIFMVGFWMVLIDCLMTFFGSTANDACFNAMITDQTDDTNRGKVESILSVLPLFATVLMMVMGMFLHLGATPDDYLQNQITNGTYKDAASALAPGWFLFFLLCGLIVFLCGVLSLFLIPKDKCVPNRDEPYLKNLVYGFRPSIIKSNKLLYIALLIFLCFNSAINAFMPYYMVYMNLDTSYGGAGLVGMPFYITVGVIFILATIITILNGIFLLDRLDNTKQLFVSFLLTAIGLFGLIFLKDMASFMVFGTFLITGYLITTSILGTIIRDLTPKKEVGLFQGVRMFFAVLLPMITGPLISGALFPVTEYNDPTNPALAGKTPSSVMFVVALCFIALSLVPTVWLYFEARKSGRLLGKGKETKNADQTSDPRDA